MCDGIAVWTREMARPANERSPTVLAHEVARSQRMADVFERFVCDQLLLGPTRMLHFILAVALDRARYCDLDDLTSGRPGLAKWMRAMSDRPSMQRTAPP
jgi:glutathione S-transferase